MWFRHDRYLRGLNLDISIRNISPLRIGSGRASKLVSPIDLPVIRISIDGVDKPFIPGSSIKGVFRSTAEYIARSEGIDVCSMGEGCKNRYMNELQETLKNGDYDKAVEILKSYCLICKVFGSSSYGSHIHFTDFYPEGDVSTGIKTGIGINRSTGTVRRGALFTIEYVNPGAIFKGRISMVNPPNYVLGLIVNVIDMMNTGIVRLGGMKTRGFGYVNITVTGIDGYIFDNGYRGLREINRLEKLDDEDVEISFDPRNIDDFLEECRRAWREYVSKKVKGG